MIDDTPLKYHQATIELLDAEPSLSEDAVRIIDAREQACGADFPASVKEWFSVEGAKRMFDHTGNHLESLEELGRPEETRQGYLRVATEIQAVVGWYVRPDQSDDPPVYHNNDQWYEDDLSKVDWQPNSASFTNFIFDTIAAAQFDGWLRGCYLVATAEQPGAEVLKTLRATFKEGPRTESPSKVYRFFDEHALIAIRCDCPEHSENPTAEWTVDADSREALYERTELIWPYHGLAQSFRLESHPFEPDQPGWRVIEQLAKEYPHLGPCQTTAKKPSRRKWRFWRCIR
jgi:hypothetical protein